MKLFKNISLQQLLKGALTTFSAYPLVLLSAFIGTAVTTFLIDLNYDERHLYPSLDKLMLLSALGLILFFTLELLVRRYRLSQRRRALLLSAGVAFLGLYFVLLPAEVEEKQLLRFFLLALALHLAASYAMFLNRREENAFWQFNKVLFLRILTAVLYTAVLFIGLTIAVVALQTLFSVDVPSEFYLKLWVFMVGVFNTWFFLAGVPANVQELEGSHLYPKGLKVFTQFVLLPLVTLYLLILYAYFGKIVVQWTWPEGWVSVLVLCFSVAGILSLLLIHPIRFEKGNNWMRTFAKWFYRALFPLIILLLLAIWRRVSEYGITEFRYIVLGLALWLFCIALYFLLSRQKNIKFIPVTLSIVAVLAAFGPFNAFQVSKWSQTNRLQELLEQNDVLAEGQIQEKHAAVSRKVEQEVSSIVRYLSEMHDLRDLQPWFKQDLDSALTANAGSAWSRWAREQERAEAVVQLMGMKYRNSYESEDEQQYLYFSRAYNEKENLSYNIEGYNYMLFINSSITNEDEAKDEYSLGGAPLIFGYKKGETSLYIQTEEETIHFNLLPKIKELEKRQRRPFTAEDLTVQLEGEKQEYKLFIQSLNVNKQQGYTIESIDGYLLIRLKD